jgi:hypothetical protein
MMRKKFQKKIRSSEEEHEIHNWGGQEKFVTEEHEPLKKNSREKFVSEEHEIIYYALKEHKKKPATSTS